MKIKFKCLKTEFKNIDMFLHFQEYIEKPNFDEIEIDVENIKYNYKIINENNYFYIVTN